MHSEFVRNGQKAKLKIARSVSFEDTDVMKEKFRADERSPSLPIYNVPKISAQWRPSVVPIVITDKQRKVTEISQKTAYDLYCEVHDKKSKFAEDAHSFFCDGVAMWNPSPSTRRLSSILVGTDCSGIEAPIFALINMGIPFIHSFASDIDKDVVRTTKANTQPLVIYDS